MNQNSSFDVSTPKLEEEIAIVGMACRFPGANNYNEFWQNLEQGVNSITEIPSSRWDMSDIYSSLPDQPHKSISKWGGFIQGVDRFDASFFGISPREAQKMDPQHRLMLELSWTCVEDAGYSPTQLSGASVGVYIGICNYDYDHLLHQDEENTDGHSGTGSWVCMVANRISAYLNVNGPSLPIDTACSSSLVAIHQAVNAMKNAECEMALVGGVSVLCTPMRYIQMSQQAMLSPVGLCKTFDSQADGYVRGEGAGVIFLKSYRKAIADRDHIYGVIKGSAVNHGGQARTLTSPNIYAQAKVIRAALEKARVDPQTISYIEAHGTGTPLGDPIEINGLIRAFRQGNNSHKTNYCGLGTVKTNIGHLEGAAGIAGIIKLLLAIKHRKLPPIVNFQQLNPRIKLKDSPFYIVREARDWDLDRTFEDPEILRRCGVSSFGIGGTNAHIVLEESPVRVNSEDRVELERPAHLLTLSAKTEKALQELSDRYQQHLETHRELELADICYTANGGRTPFNYRLAVVATTKQELVEKLQHSKTSEERTELFWGQTNNKTPKIAFLFTGQGSQYINMGRQLYQQAPVFRETLDWCDAILRSQLERPLLEVLYPEKNDGSSGTLIDQTAYTQPALFALEYALAKLWQSWGIKPEVVMGHSVGEYVAATLAGVFSLEDGLKLIATRGRLMQQLPPGGEMMSVLASESRVTEIVAPYRKKVTIAAFNGPQSIVISGVGEAIAALEEKFSAIDIKTKRLQVSHAFHSPLMEPMLAKFTKVAKKITYHPPQIPLISNVTGQLITEAIASSDYWVNHIRQPVHFFQSMTALHQQQIELFLEIGPKPILLGMGRQCLPEDAGMWLPSLRPGADEWQQILSSLGQLYVRGCQITWSEFDRYDSRQKVALPTYPFQGEQYWIETNKRSAKKLVNREKTIHPLLGQRLPIAGQQQLVQFASLLGEDEPSYLKHHRVFGEALFPTTGYLEMALAAGKNRFKTPYIVVEDVVIGRGLVLPLGELKTVQTILTTEDRQTYKLQIFTPQPQQEGEEPQWLLHTYGKIKPAENTSGVGTFDLENYRRECDRPVEIKHHYQYCQRIGIEYGTCFQGIQQLWVGSGQSLGKIQLPQPLVAEATDYQLHPALLDAALQVIFQALPETIGARTYLPISLNKLTIYASPGLSLWSYAVVNQPAVKGQEMLDINVMLGREDGQLIAAVEGLLVKLVSPQSLLGIESQSITDWLYEIDWRSWGRLGRLLPTGNLRTPEELAQQLTPTIAELVGKVDNKSGSEIPAKIEQLSIDYVVRGLQEMGWSYKVGDRLSSEAAASRLGIIPSQRRLFNRLLQMLAEVGILEQVEQQWQVLKPFEKVNPEITSQTLLDNYQEAAPELKLLQRCASQLSGVLRGAKDPVQLVFPEGDLTTATQVYQDSTVAKVLNTIVQKVAALASEKIAPSRSIRLLEIGAGTGGTTSYILTHLKPQQTEYIFTDLGALFTAKAQERFADYPFVRYQTLDIENSPTNQGFAAHQYDIIIAANVLHATTSMKQTLTNVRQLLTPGGLLILLEVTTRQRWLDLVFGLLEGWWRFQDFDLRPDHPLLTRTKWQQLLSETGFDRVAALPELEGLPEILTQQSVIVARADDTTLEPTTASSKHWLILADQGGIGRQLATKLESVGDRCTLAIVGDNYQQLTPQEWAIDPNNGEDFARLIATVTAKTPLYGVVQCWTTEAGADKTIDASELKDFSKLGCGTTLFLVQALVKSSLSQPPRFWIVTCGSQAVPKNNPVIPGVSQSSVWGMGKAIGLEHPELNCIRIDLDPQESVENRALALFEEIWSEDGEDQVALRENNRYVARLVPSHYQQANLPSTVPSQPFQLAMTEKGSLDKLILEPCNRRSPAAGEIEIRVFATGLNFRDVLIALDMYPGMGIMGGDCAGEIVAVGAGVTGFKVGDSVMAMAPGSFSQYVTINANLAVLKPETLNFAEAASIPANFLTAYYALHHLAKISAGERILIHAAAGGTGMAAVQIAQQAGAEVFATASPGKWETLQKMGVKHIMNSRTLEFADQIMEITRGEGVNVVLNSLTSGDFISKTLSVVGSGGRFVELAIRDIWDVEKMQESKLDLSYFPINLVELAAEQPELIQSMFQELIDKFTRGLLQPPPLKLFPLEDIIGAFRYMQQAKHIGKIVITQVETKADDGVEKALAFRDDASYLITGGLGGLGLLISQWMVERGAKHLILLGRRDPDEKVQQKLAELAAAGARVVVEKADVSDGDSMTRVMENIAKSNIPLSGAIHAAGLLSDAILENQTWESFEKVMNPKVLGAWYLHQLTQNQPLDFFILFSSAASLFGLPGQANHCAANAFLDGLAHHRRTLGLPGLSIHWGTVSQIGEAAEKGADVRFKEKGVGAIAPGEVLTSLELLIKETDTEIGVVPINWSAWQEKVGSSPFLADWKQTATATTVETKSEFLQQLEAAVPGDRRSLLVAHVCRQIALVLGMSSGQSISLEQGFFDLGMDSLTSVELRNKLQTSLNCSVSSTLAFDYPTVGKLVDYLAEQLKLNDPPSVAVPEPAPSSEIAQLSESELEASVLAEIEALEKLI